MIHRPSSAVLAALFVLLPLARARAGDPTELPGPDRTGDGSAAGERPPVREVPPLQRLVRAASDGDVAEVERLLAAGAPVSDPSGSWSPLQSAAYRPHLPVIKALVQHGAPMSPDGDLALGIILDYDDAEHQEAAWWLLEHGAGQSAAMHEQIISAIHNRRLPLRAVRFIDVRGAEGTRLYEALLSFRGPDEYVEVTKTFLDHGFPLAPASMSETLLERFARWGSLPAVEHLLGRGVSVEHGKGHRPLVAAVHAGEVDMAHYLLRRGARAHLDDEEVAEAVDDLCPTDTVISLLTERLHVRLAGAAGAKLLANGIRGCGSELAQLDHALALGASPAALAHDSALLYGLEKPETQPYVDWLRAHGVELRPEERERLRLEAERETAREREGRAAELAEQQRREREERARARQRFLSDHRVSFAGMGAAVLLGLAALALRERAYPGPSAPRWVGTSMGVLAVLPGVALGAVLGPPVGEALLGPGASSSVFSWPSGAQIGEAVGPVLGAVGGLVAGLALRDRLSTSRGAYYAVPGSLFVLSAITLAM